jgi:hypothetical protein
MHSARFRILAGSALAVILAATSTAGAAPANSPIVQPASRDYSTPGSMPKPSATIRPADDGLRFRGTLPAAAGAGPRLDSATPLAPASHPQRWRWMPRNLGQTYVMLNIPDYYLRVYHDGHKVWQTRVVVGKPDHQTPLLTETMKYITVNPTWNVPQSIIYNELLPIYETSDPQIFERQGLKVERNPDGTVRVYQPPGERNALGQIRFNFPNKFLVYQHDTPERYYFSQEPTATAACACKIR